MTSTVLALGLVACSPQQAPPPGPSVEHRPNTLTDQERSQGWRLLFDGKSPAGWRGFNSEEVPSGWAAEDGTLHFSVREGAGRGDIMTRDAFTNFELKLDWKISPGGNSGIFFHVDQSGDYSWTSGPEFQVLDNSGHGDGQNPATSAGSNYALHAPAVDATKAVGEFNQVRILVKDGHVEHWMNGQKLLEYQLGSPEWEGLVKASKFVDYPNYGRAGTGHIVLQDHGDPVWYRNIKMREL